MSYNWSIVQKNLYGILKGSGDDISMFDVKGNRTIDPEEASRFFVKFKSADKEIGSFMILVAIHDQGQSSFINIKTPELQSDEDFQVVHTIRDHIRNAIGRKEGIKVDWQVFDHEIDPREEAVNNIKESKDISKVFGSTKSSFQRIGEAKLIIRHTGSVNEEKHGARTRQIRAIFVENRLGERFAYPHLHMTGARAFARHISNGGTNHDSIAEAIFEMSKDYISLRNTGHQLRKNNGLTEWVGSLRENMYRINKTLKSLHGPKGYNSTSPNLTLENVLTDNQSIQEIHNKLAETCRCQPEDPMHQDLGRAAHYISTYPMTQTPMTFSWSGQPDITPPDDYSNVLERLNWQLSQLSGACNVKESAARLAEIASKIKSGMKIEEDELDFIREAFSSNLSYVPEDTRLPEEKELDEFIDSFDGEVKLEEDPFEPSDEEDDEQPIEEDARPVDNFTIDDIKHLETMRDFNQMKEFAKKLIATPSRKPMKPQKIAWFSQAIDAKRNPAALIKMMYDLLLGGEGHGVLGSRHSTDPNVYRKSFGEETIDRPELTDMNPSKEEFAYQSGYDAIIHGRHEDDCPYEDGSELASKWHEGYKDGLLHDYKDDPVMSEESSETEIDETDAIIKRMSNLAGI